tara:strand:- start:705 stop:1082 length:378 start_codon:yes stop_codon:yes gene_type:complete
MAALLYLPRLFIYHNNSPLGSIQSETFIIMERNLARVIMLPAMLFTYFSGIGMLINKPYLIYDLSIVTKFIFVIILSAVHAKFSIIRKELEKNIKSYSDLQLRIWNEIPTCIMIIIVILIVFRPF